MLRFRHSFTLFEILISIALLGLLTGLFSFGIKDLITYQKFEKSAHTLKQVIKKTRLLAQEVGKDLTFTIDGLACCGDKEKPFQLEKVQKVTFNGKTCENISFVFYSNGLIQPEGTLELFQGEKSFSIQIGGE